MNAKSLKPLPLLLAVPMLAACGGGGGGRGDGGGSSPGAASPSNNWDQMLWDQGNWG